MRLCYTVRPVESVNISEAARRLGVSRKTIYRRIDAGELEAVDTPDGKRVLVPPHVERDNLSDFTQHVHTSAHPAHVPAHPGRTPPNKGEGSSPLPSETDINDELRARLERAESRIDRLIDTVSEQNRTIQVQTIRLAQLEGRMIDADTSSLRKENPTDSNRLEHVDQVTEQPRTAPVVAAEPPVTPRRRLTLRDWYRAWRRGL